MVPLVVLIGGSTFSSESLGFVVVYLAYGIVGLILGFFVAAALPRLAQSGAAFVWIAPTALVALCVADELRRGTHEAALVFIGTGEAGWVSMLITLPAFGCCAYSLATAINNRFGSRGPSTGAR